MEIIQLLIVQLVHFSIHNKRNVWLVLVAVLNVLIVILVRDAHLILFMIQLVSFVQKNVVMLKDIFVSAMMATLFLEMGVLLHVQFKLVTLAEAVHLPLLITA